MNREVEETTIIYGDNGAPIMEKLGIEVVVSQGPDAEKRVFLPESGLTIGTSFEANLQLTDRAVSRAHLSLAPATGGVQVRDLGSTNGVFVGKTKISEAVIPVGSSIKIGETTLELLRAVEHIPLPLSRRRKLGDLIGSTAAMRQVYTLLETAAGTASTILIEGATGTGKELAARAIHDYSPRAQGPFQVVDCGAVSPTLIEAELFGHTKGAFTGADRERPGAFELARGGTLFFDEIGELPQNLQPKLLRAIEGREIQRVGSSVRISIDVRFVAATNRNLEEEVKMGRFREDLLYRLNVFKVHMPPLRQRVDDIPLLVEHFLGETDHPAIGPEMIERFRQHHWPGNVRELRNAVEKALILHGAASSAEEPQASPRRDDPMHPPRINVQSAEAVALESDSPFAQFQIDSTRPFKDVKAELVALFEQLYIGEVLQRTQGNISAAARESGIDRKHLERLVKKHVIKSK